MAVLLSLQKLLKRQGGVLVLAGLNQQVTEVFAMVGFDVVFGTYPDVEQAVNSFAPAHS